MIFRDYIEDLAKANGLGRMVNGTAVSIEFVVAGISMRATYDAVYRDVRPVVTSQPIFARDQHPDPLEYNRHCLQYLGVQLKEIDVQQFQLIWKVSLDDVGMEEWNNRLGLFSDMVKKSYVFLNPPKVLRDTFAYP